MASAAHAYKPRRIEGHLSPARLSVLFGNVALWAALIVGLVVIAGR